MCDIIRLSHWSVRVSLYLEDEDDMMWRMKIIRYLCRLTCASWLTRLRTSRSYLCWTIVFGLGFSVSIVMGAPAGYPLGCFIKIYICLTLWNSFSTCEGYLVVVSIVSLSGLMIRTIEGYLVGLSLQVPLRSPLESQNPGSEMPGTLLVAPIGLWFFSELFRCLCYCCRLINFCEATRWGVVISCVPNSGAFITSKMNSVRYLQVLEFITL